MNALLWLLISAILIWFILLLLNRFHNMKKRGFEISPGFVMWRTKRGISLLDRIARSSRRGWTAFGIAGAVAGGVFMVFIFLNLTSRAIDFVGSIGAPSAGTGVMLVVPGLTIPLVSGLIALATVLLVHEPAHGIVARRVGIPLKSTGLLLLAVIPGAFVEPNEKKMKKASVSKRLQVYGAGPFANIIFGFLCFGLLLTLVVPLPGLYIWDVAPNTPADNENLQPGMRLMEIGYEGNAPVGINNYQDFDKFIDNTQPGDNIILVTDNDNFKITLENHPTENKGYIGVFLVESTSRAHLFDTTVTGLLIFWRSPRAPRWGLNKYSYNYRAPGFVINLLVWMFILNLGIGLFNLLPLKPLDGGGIAECLAEKASSRSTAKRVAIIFSVISLVVLALNLLDWLV